MLPELNNSSQHSGCQSALQIHRCAVVMSGGACSLVFAAHQLKAAPVAGWGSSSRFSSPLAPRGWQPLAMTTRLTCVHTEQSSHRLSHEACSVDLTQPSSFCKRLIASLTPPRVHALSLSRLCRNTDACLKSIFSWTAEATSYLSNQCSHLEL